MVKQEKSLKWCLLATQLAKQEKSQQGYNWKWCQTMHRSYKQI